MCYDDHAHPPMPPISGGSADGKDIVITATDGNQFSAHIAYAEQPDGPQVLIYPDIRGLHQFYKELALRFAEVGIRALAIDYFGRTAETNVRDESFEWQPHIEQITIPTFLTDVEAALAYLNGLSKTKRATYVIGFCRGGTLALHTSAEEFDLAGIIPFYAGLSRSITGEKGTTFDRAAQARYPVLGLFGGADPGIPASDTDRLDKELDQANMPHEIVVYPGATHSFFDRRSEQFANESADAWTRILNFIQTGSPKK